MMVNIVNMMVNMVNTMVNMGNMGNMMINMDNMMVLYNGRHSPLSNTTRGSQSVTFRAVLEVVEI